MPWTTTLWELLGATYPVGVVFRRAEIIHAILPDLVQRVGCIGKTPEQTLSRELQRLRDLGLLEFLGRGAYRIKMLKPLKPQGFFWQGEVMVSRILDELGLSYETQKRFDWLYGKDACGNLSGPLSLDFYIPRCLRKVAVGGLIFWSYGPAAVEFDGKQHQEAVEYYGGAAKLVDTQRRDRIKDRRLRKRQIVLVRLTTLRWEKARAQLLEWIRAPSETSRPARAL